MGGDQIKTRHGSMSTHEAVKLVSAKNSDMKSKQKKTYIYVRCSVVLSAPYPSVIYTMSSPAGAVGMTGLTFAVGIMEFINDNSFFSHNSLWA